MGRVERLWIKRARQGPLDETEMLEAVAGEGLAGNANKGGRRQVTVISREAWDQVAAELGRDVDPALRRANVLVSGVELEHSRGRTLSLGEVEIEIQGETRPCNLMEETCPGLQAALDPEWRGGVYGTVVKAGSVRVGDSATLS